MAALEQEQVERNGQTGGSHEDHMCCAMSADGTHRHIALVSDVLVEQSGHVLGMQHPTWTQTSRLSLRRWQRIQSSRSSNPELAQLEKGLTELVQQFIPKPCTHEQMLKEVS